MRFSVFKVGLAVGDIDAIQQNATLKRLAMQVEFVAEIEDRYPRFITRRLYRPTLVFKPNTPSPWKRFVFIQTNIRSYALWCAIRDKLKQACFTVVNCLQKKIRK